jgi:phosphatidylserine/phosphatidylglycerophosphate/cardiolipin synthase-like enzyme
MMYRWISCGRLLLIEGEAVAAIQFIGLSDWVDYARTHLEIKDEKTRGIREDNPEQGVPDPEAAGVPNMTR